MSPLSRSRRSRGICPSSGTGAPIAVVEPVGDLLAATAAEHLDPLAAVRARQPGHVLDDSGDPLVGLQRDRAGALRNLRRGLLGGRHDEHLGARHELGHRDGDVTGAGGQVHQQHVEVAPVDVGQELLQRAVQHRPTPDDRRLLATNMPIEMTFTSWATGGRIISSTWVGRPVTPSIRGIEWP